MCLVDFDGQAGRVWNRIRRMKFVRMMERILLASVVVLGPSQLRGEESYPGQPLTQVEFNRLVPITYPLVTTKFTALRPTSYPVIQPGVARVHIIERLLHPLEQPLLRAH
jgi:hypothetical protein